MQGLLGNSFDDPRTMATLQLAQGLLGGGGSMQRLATGLQGYGSVMGASKKEEEERKRRQLQGQMLMQQLEQAKAQQAAQQAAAAQQARDDGILRQNFAPMPGPNPDGSAGVAPQFDPRGMLGQGMSLGGLGQAAQLNQMMQPPQRKLTAYKPGDEVRDEAGNVAFRVPTQEKEPEALRAFAAAYGKDSPEYAQALRQYARKLATPSAGVQVNVGAEKPLIGAVGAGLGKQIDESLSAARAAIPAIQTAQTLRSAVDSGKLVSGPGASFRVLGLQLGQMLGVGGENGAEILANTRTAIQSMAQAELDAAQQMKGQGQITESERDIIRRAAAGRIDDLTPPEMRLLSGAMEKTARFKIDQHKRNLKGLSKLPGAESIMPFYQLDDPPAYTPPTAGPAVRKFNPATGKIE